MIANIQIAFDESTLGKVYTWLLAQNDTTSNISKFDDEKDPEEDSAITASIRSNMTATDDR